MEDRVERHLVAAEHDPLLAPVHLGDPGGLAGEELRREVAERRDQLRLDQLDLPEEVRLAGLDLLGLRVAVARRPALQDVAHVDVLARQPDAGEQLAEQLPGGADERHALLVLVEARRLADEHQLGGRRARAEDDLGAGLGERAALAAGDLVAVRDQRQISRSCHSSRRNTRRRTRAAADAVRCERRRELLRRPSSCRNRGTPDRGPTSRPAPRNGTRSSCRRTRRSASGQPYQGSHLAPRRRTALGYRCDLPGIRNGTGATRCSKTSP